MKLRDILTLAGAFFMAFGGTLKANGDSKAAWWIGEAMITLGPLLLASRAIHKAEPDKPAPPENTESP